MAPQDAPAVAAGLAAIARTTGVPERIALQGRVPAGAEAFIGVRARTDLGPVIVVGLGGVLVERTGQVVGRLLPVAKDDVAAMLDELGDLPWNRRALTRTVLAVADLGQRASPWLESIDVNPVICDEDGCTAVDALLLIADDPSGGA